MNSKALTPKTTFIYGLVDPRTRVIRYVGKANDPETRLKRGHLPKSRITTSHKSSWIKGLLKEGLTPEIVILEECLYEIWEDREKYHISKHANLTNMTEGGEAIEPTPEIVRKSAEARKGRVLTEEHKRRISEGGKGRVHTEESKRKMSEMYKLRGTTDVQREAARLTGLAARGRKASAETRAKMSKAQKGQISPLRGRVNSPETLEKIRRGRLNSAGAEKARKPLAQYTLGGDLVRTWRSSRDAADGIGKTRSVISRCARDERKQAHGYIWIQIERDSKPPEKLSSEEMERRAKKFAPKKVSEETKRRMSKGGTRRELLQYTKDGEFVKEWPSAKIAAEVMGVTSSALTQCAGGRSRSSAGYVWRHKDGGSAQRSARPVAQYSLAGDFIKTWSSVGEIVKEMGLYVQAVYQCVQGVSKTCGNYIWIYVSEPTFQEDRLPLDQEFRLKTKRAKCVVQYRQDGTYLRTWPSAAAAARSVGLSASTLATAAKTGVGTVGGFRWKYVDLKD